MRRSGKVIHQAQEIIKVLKQFEGGASIEQIKTASGLDAELRTLQRRLAELKKMNLVKTTGARRSTRYHLAIPRTSRSGADIGEKTTTEEEIIPLSDESKKIHSIVSLPEQRRAPVGYKREFLERYQPNADSYLGKEEKEKLAQIGKTTREDQPAGTYAKEVLNRLLIDLAWNSSRLEGNTYSLLDTERLISHGVPADNKSAMEAQMILNHKDAIEFIVQSADEIGFNRYTILNLHALLSNNLLADPAASGRLRNFAVGITNSVFTPLGRPQLIEEMFELVLAKARQIENPFEQAFFVMVHLPYLQPFDDVNKRVSRLAANIPFNRYNLSPLSFTEVPKDLYFKGLLGVYELNRVDLLKDIFLWAYERSSQKYAAIRQSLGEPDPLRMKYREVMRSLITEIIANAISRGPASDMIKFKAQQLPVVDQEKFVEATETELLSLHEGNFARYFVRPAEFRRWKDVWDLG